jgi:peptide/nickel transport system permease protein
MLSRLVHGSRTILILAPISVLVSVIVGTFWGLVSGYFGGVTDEIVMRVLDAIMAFPTILLYLIIIAAIGPSAMNVVIAITFVGAPGVARLVRSLTLDVRTRDYVRAAETRGESSLYIMFVEILPNARGPLIIDSMLRIGYAIFAIGTLGFLGLGLPPPTPDWGGMVSEARKYIWTSPWGVLWPALAISSLVVGLNLFADGLREESTRYQ